MRRERDAALIQAAKEEPENKKNGTSPGKGNGGQGLSTDW